MTTLAEIRTQYPQYNDMNDDALLDAMHRKFYSDMPRAEFDKRLGASSGQPQSKPYEGWGEYAKDLGRTALQGVSLGFGDELTAGVRSVLPKSVGGATYDQALKEERDAVHRFREENPATAFGTELAAGFLVPGMGAARSAQVAGSALRRIGQAAGTGAGFGAVGGFGGAEGGIGNRIEGAVAGGAVGGVLGGGIGVAGEGVRSIRRAYANVGEAGAYGKIAEDLPSGANGLSDEIAAGASRQNITTNRRTLDILGEEMDRAGGDLNAARQATINRIAQETGVTPQTAAAQIRRLTQVHEDSPLMLGEYPAVSQSDQAQRMRPAANVDLDELGRIRNNTTQPKLDYLANNGNAQSAQNVRNAISERQETLGPTMHQTFEGMSPRVGGHPATIVDTEAMELAARRTAQQEYRAAAQQQQNFQPLLTRVLNRWNRVLGGRTSEDANAIRNALDLFYDPIQTVTANGQNGPRQMRMISDIEEFTRRRSELNRMIQDSYRVHPVNGRQEATGRTLWLQRLKHTVDFAVGHNNPAWQQANRRWADMNLQRTAQHLGDAFTERAGPAFRRQMREFTQMAPEAQDIVRVHFLQKQFDKLTNLKDTDSVSKMFSNDQSRNMIAALFGDEAAVTFARAVRDQRVAEASQQMMRNSATHRRGVAQKQMDAETGLVAAVESANAKGVRNWLMQRIMQMVTEHRNAPMADILTTPINDTARVARHLHRMRQQEARLARFNTPSRRPLAVAGAIGAVTGGMIGREGSN